MRSPHLLRAHALISLATAASTLGKGHLVAGFIEAVMFSLPAHSMPRAVTWIGRWTRTGLCACMTGERESWNCVQQQYTRPPLISMHGLLSTQFRCRHIELNCKLLTFCTATLRLELDSLWLKRTYSTFCSWY